MCNYLTYYHTCGYHGSERFRTSDCDNVEDLIRCRDTDRTIVLSYPCKYCLIGERRRSHPTTTLLPTPPPSPGSEDGQDITFVVPSKHEFFHRQPGFRFSDPFAADRDKQVKVKKLRLQPATKEEPIKLECEDTESSMTGRFEEDPFGLDGVRPRAGKKWWLGTMLNLRSKASETGRCCMEAKDPEYGIDTPGYIVDDRCESTV